MRSPATSILRSSKRNRCGPALLRKRTRTVQPLPRFRACPNRGPTPLGPSRSGNARVLYQRTLLNPGHRRCVRTRRQIHFTRASLLPGTWNRAARASPPHRDLSKENQLRFTWASIQVSAPGTPRYKEAWRLRPELPQHLRSHCGRCISTRRSWRENLLRRLARARSGNRSSKIRSQ